MTVAYRLCSSRYQSNSGEGARLYGGRWNFAGFPAIYAASSPSLAALEVLVHYSVLPRDYILTEIEILDQFIEVVTDEQLPERWNQEPASSSPLASLGSIPATQLGRFLSDLLAEEPTLTTLWPATKTTDMPVLIDLSSLMKLIKNPIVGAQAFGTRWFLESRSGGSKCSIKRRGHREAFRAKLGDQSLPSRFQGNSVPPL